MIHLVDNKSKSFNQKILQLATRMATRRYLGRLGDFKPDEEMITAYLERVDLYFEANGIKEAARVATFLTVIGAHGTSLA